MKKWTYRKKVSGQTAVEYTVVIILVLGAFLATQNYMKRGIQGRWKSAIDDMGDQYDPRYSNSVVNASLEQTITTTIVAMNDDEGFWTARTDITNSTQKTVGNVAVGAY